MTTDVDHCERVLAGQFSGRRCGRTTAQCYRVVKMLAGGQRRVFYVVPLYGWVEHTRRILLPMLAEFGFRVESQMRDRISIAGGASVEFVRVEEIHAPESMRGMMVRRLMDSTERPVCGEWYVPREQWPSRWDGPAKVSP